MQSLTAPTATPVTTAYFQKLPANGKLKVDTDVGNDTDDANALVYALQPNNSVTLNGISTTLYRPYQKACIAAKICNFFQRNDVPIYPGYGCDPKSAADFMATYPFWPEMIFKVPGFGNAVSAKQGVAFEREDLPHSSKQLQPTPIQYYENDIVLGLAPYTNIANALESCGRLNRIVLMGGFFTNEVSGQIERPGYNTAIDPAASAKVLMQTKHPVLIFNSQHIKDWKFAWSEAEIRAIINSQERKKPLGDAMANDLDWYWNNKRPNRGDLVMADVLTTYVGVLHPELIEETQPVEFTFNSPIYHNPQTNVDEKIHMMHPQAKMLFSVKKTEQGNVHIVTKIKDVGGLRNKIVQELAVLFFFKTEESFAQAVAREQTLIVKEKQEKEKMEQSKI